MIGVAVGAAAAGSALRRRGGGGLGSEAAAGALALAPALFALRGGELASYHGVEHKAIAAYEQDAPDAADAAKEHDRCGSNLVAPMLAANVAGSVLVRRLLGRPGPVANAAVALSSMAAAVEIFAWSERHADTAPGARPPPPGPRAPARAGHARARRAPARGRARRAGRDPARRGVPE